MTCIDLETGWFETVGGTIIDQSSARISKICNEVWISRYPMPRKLIFGNVSEFKRNLIPLFKYFSVKPTCTTIKKSQANAIVGRSHQVVVSMLNTQYLANVMIDTVDPWKKILTSITYAVRFSHHSTLQATPGQLVFGRGMLLDINFQPNYKEMWIRKKNVSNIIISMKMQSKCNTTMGLATTHTFSGRETNTN